MARRSRTADPELLRLRLIDLLEGFQAHLQAGTLREQVVALIPASETLRDLGASLVPSDFGTSGRDRILAYLRSQTGCVIAGSELMIVSGIGDYPRRIRELRKEDGWPILSGNTAREMRQAREDGAIEGDDSTPPMGTDDYLLVEDLQDRDAAFRWQTANRIRRGPGGIQAKLLEFFRANVGRRVTSEELRYVSNDKSEWARRTRELRTEEGWPIITRYSGDPDLPVGVYVLAEDKQAPVHDRHISELVRRAVLERDAWTCQWLACGWSKARADVDPRFLEAHHIEHHAHGGSNEEDNLVTLCNLHHDEVHRTQTLLLTPDCKARLGI